MQAFAVAFIIFAVVFVFIALAEAKSGEILASKICSVLFAILALIARYLAK